MGIGWASFSNDDAKVGRAAGKAAEVGITEKLELLRRPLRRRRTSFYSIEAAATLALLLEFFAISAGGYVAYLATAPGVPTEGWRYILASLFCATAIVGMLDYQRLYHIDKLSSLRVPFLRVAMASSVAVGGLLLAALAAAGSVPYLSAWLLTFFGATVVSLVVGRLFYAHALQTIAARGLFSRNVIVIGAGEEGNGLIEALDRLKRPWTRVLGVFDDRVRDESRRVPRIVGDVPVLGTMQDAITYSRRVRVDDIVIALPWSSPNRISEVLRVVDSIPADIHLAADSMRSVSRQPMPEQQNKIVMLDGIPALSLSRKPVSGWNYLAKNALDKSMAAVGLTMLAPLFLVIAILIKLDSKGPVFFRQPRYGLGNKLIGVFKFRSMYANLSDVKADKLATRNDPRVTRIGRFLRRSSIDELPQLINVLLGQMSIVGPRPHAQNAKAAGKLYQDVVSEYSRRHRIKPGITGWAQIQGWRGETDTEEKILKRCEHDLYYIDNWSVLFDIYIIFATVIRVPFQKDVY